MAFCREWDERYSANSHMSIWPWSDLVSYVMRYVNPKGPDFKVLELGCGMGANIPFFRSLNVQYHALEGSQTAVAILHAKYPDLVDTIRIGDFTESIPDIGGVDLVVDRASITHNNSQAIIRTLDMVRNALKPGGKYIGIDWFSTSHTDYRCGEQAEDPYTRCNITTGQFIGTGRVHFSDKQHLLGFFTGFNVEKLEHKILKTEMPEDDHMFASWNIYAKVSGR